jgi:hypothetical protein
MMRGTFVRFLTQKFYFGSKNNIVRWGSEADFQFLGPGIFIVAFWQRAPLNSFFLQFSTTIFLWTRGFSPHPP